MSCCNVACQDLGLNTKDNDVFTKAQHPSCCNRYVYIMYRLFVAFYYTGYLVLYLVRQMDNVGLRLFVYVSNWSITLFAVYNIIAMLNSIRFSVSKTEEADENETRHNASTRSNVSGPGTIGRQVNERIFNQPHAFQRMTVKRRRKYKTPASKKTQWLLFNISCNSSFIISAVYWISVYVLDSYNKPSDEFEYVDIIHVTAVPSVLCVIELLLLATPVHFVHFHFTCWFGLLYVFFNVVYWLAGGTNDNGETYIYDLANYDDDFLTAIIAIVCLFAAVVISQGFMWIIYCLRMLTSNENPIACLDDTESVEVNVPIYENLAFESPYATVSNVSRPSSGGTCEHCGR
ncbi:protein rolling stone-like [Anneissia japonica]|uniref:protein rolling stone-like n=1 Tax=Anneissia japonica TaxID=1529436 RepID=UPI0014255B0E|nr:protein rolling stone-like [Anneissia japonica]